MERELNKKNIEKELKDYLKKINSMKKDMPKWEGNVLKFLNELKRGEVTSGPYSEKYGKKPVSLYENSNRIFSDLVILLGVRQLLTKPPNYNFKLPFTEYKARFGTTQGYDLEANNGKQRLIGEAFNVAESFFPEKMYRSKKSLNGWKKKVDYKKVDYKLIMFNKDAVKDGQDYINKSKKEEIIYLPVDVLGELKIK